MTAPPTPGTEPGRQQVVEWAACGIAYAAARLVPVPFLDDVVRERAARTAVVRTLAAAGRTFPVEHVEPLWSPSQGLARGVLRTASAVPRKLLLFPVRKYAALVSSVRGGPADVLGVVLLGRATRRALDAGLLAGGTPAALRAEAVRVRAAYDAARRGTDLRLAAAALAAGLAEVKELTRAAVAAARRLADRDARAAAARPALAEDGPLGEGAGRVEETLRRPDVAEQLRRFDARFDEALARR